MDLLTGLSIGKQSLLTHGAALATLADNIANANTPGFKDARSEFSDIFTDSIGSLFSSPLNSGNGVQIDAITNVQSQGPLETTNRSLDLAVTGKGLFIVSDGKTTSYTRAGNFTTDPEGNIVTVEGQKVMGFTTASPESLVALNVQNGVSTGKPTGTVALEGNLDDGSTLTTTPPGAPASFTDINNLSSFSAEVEVVDSLGKAHGISLHFFHTGILSWDVQAYVDGAEVGGTAGTPSSLGTGTLTFLGTGAQPAGSTASVVVTPAWANGAVATPITITLDTLTGFSTSSFVSGVTKDGSIPGAVVGVRVERDGSIFAQLSSQAETKIGTVALADFINPEGLDKFGDNRFGGTTKAGTPDVGAPQTEARGTIHGSTLENSTVDLASDFIDVVRFQRGYQASSKVLSTFSELLNSTIQLA